MTLGLGAVSRAANFRATVRRNRADPDFNVAWAMRLDGGRVVKTERVTFAVNSSFGCAPLLSADATEVRALFETQATLRTK